MVQRGTVLVHVTAIMGAELLAIHTVDNRVNSFTLLSMMMSMTVQVRINFNIITCMCMN